MTQRNVQIRSSIEQLMQRLGYLEEVKSDCCSLSIVQSTALMAIGRQQGLSVNALAEQLGLDKSTASRHVTNLVQSGYVIRHESPEDRRFFSLTLTEKGIQNFNTLEATTEQFYQRIVNHMAPEDQKALEQGLEALLKALEASGCC